MQMRNPMCVQEEGGQLDSSEEGQGNGQARVERERESACESLISKRGAAQRWNDVQSGGLLCFGAERSAQHRRRVCELEPGDGSDVW
jgi:hypothetical protein